jgi:putative ABC transport system ATP-binding protein
MESLLQLINVRKVYHSGGREVKVLQDISLEVGKGEFVTIMGASGSGKTSLLNIIGCLDRSSGGSYFFQGRQVEALSDDELSDLRKRAIGFVFQSFNLLSRLTALANIELPLVYQGIGRSKRHEIAEAMLMRMGLEGKSHRLPGELSGGEQQRVAIARALAAQPQLLLADEPTGNLDSKTGKEIMGIFKGLHQEGMTILMVTHSQEMSTNADRIALIRDGQILTG